MAERRMLNKSLLNSSHFIRLSRAANQLYLYLNLSADDDGFADNVETVFRTLRCNAKHLQELIDGGWILPFDGGVVAITHWFMHNQIKKDRYKPTVFQKERAMLEKTPTGIYVRLDTDWSHAESTAEPQCSVNKNKIEKDSLDQQRSGECIPPQTADHSPMPPQAATSDDIDIDYDHILYNYQLLCPNLVPCTELTDPVKAQLRDYFRAGGNIYRLNDVFLAAGTSPWLQGENPSGWKAGLPWLLEPKNLQQVRDGHFAAWH